MPIDKSAPLRLDDDFGQIDAVAIVANKDMLKSEKRRRAFRRCGIRLGDSTNAVDSRTGTDAKIQQIDAGLEIMLCGASHAEAWETGLRRHYLRGPMTPDEKEEIMLDLAVYVGWHQEVLCALDEAPADGSAEGSGPYTGGSVSLLEGFKLHCPAQPVICLGAMVIRALSQSFALQD
ncbi:uncharacterized protein BDZ83DRAFT_649773 [Colletotrichum acutatum]|uniref:Uncharacterized protein n=1 Tax=Glomerella acutata TaxID=27357 RepID=A0AAD8URR3_GLOAC|nr:uncharacterized protein BDZ83DRAFT_649773 [Colletotrichum acutatum]KAK1727190.1 hypothetical protein BDZ83DRAFT_649773 [Colletotrichum acutatum]